MNRRTRTRILSQIVIYMVVILVACVFVGPILWIISMSFKDPLLTFALPPRFLFVPEVTSYLEVFREGQAGYKISFWVHARNSIGISLSATVASVTLGALAAYSISRFKFKGRRVLSFLILGTRMLPPVATIVPMFLVAITFGLLDTWWILISTYTAFNLPLAAWMLKGFMDAIPIELEDAAMIDGCNRMGVLVRIVLPLIAPGLAATAIFAFILAWNEFPLALTLTSQQSITLPMFVTSFMTEEGVRWGPMSAASTLIIAPAIIFVLFAQRHLVKGLTFGAVKG